MTAGLAFLWLCIQSFQGNVLNIFNANDTHWLLKTGEYILQSGHVPSVDIFSWTRSGEPWIAYQWLFEVLLAWLNRAGGLWLVGMVVCLIAALNFFFVLPSQMMSRGVRLPYVLGLMTLVMIPIWFFARPQILSFLMIPAFIMLLEDYRKNGFSKKLWSLPLLMVLWANLHSFWFLGLLIMSLYFLDTYIKERNLRLLRQPVWVLLASCLAVFINPYGFDLIAYTINFPHTPLSMDEVKPALITEPRAHIPEIAYLCFAWFFLVKTRRDLPMPGLVLALIGSVAALFMQRFVALAILLSWPYLAIALGSTATKINSELKPKLSQLPLVRNTALAALALAIGAGTYASNFPIGQSVWSQYHPSSLAVIRFLKQHPRLTQSMFCDGAIGSRQIMAGLTPVFIDTRFDFYGKKFCDSWHQVLDGEGDWQAYLNNWKIQSIAVSNEWTMNKKLKQSGDWILVYNDNRNSVWVANDANGRRLISQEEITPVSLQLADYDCKTEYGTTSASTRVESDQKQSTF